MKKTALAISLIMTCTLASIEVLAETPSTANNPSSKTDDKVERLSNAIARLQMTRDNLLLCARRFKQSTADEKAILQGALLYEEARSSFNAWVNAVLTDFSMRQSIQDTSAYEALSAEANKRAGKFLQYAKDHDTFKAISNTQGNGGISILNNISGSCDINKIMDQVGTCFVAIGKFVIDSANYWQIRFTLESLRLIAFKDLTPPDVIASVPETSSDELASMLSARLFMAIGHINSGISSYNAGFDALVNRKSAKGLSAFEESYIQEYMMTLSRLSDKAAIEKASKKLGIFERIRGN